MKRFLSIVLTGALVAAAPLVCGPSPAAAQSGGSFYKGKTVRLVIGFEPAGSYDLYARLAGRWLGRHVPGQPNVVPQNMPGAGGLSAANHVFRIAARDGTVLAALHNNIAFAQVTGTPNVEYDARKFNWIGRMAAPSDVHYAWHASGVKSFDDLFRKQVVVAGTGPSSNSVIYPTVLNQLMGTKLKILAGFKGTSPANLALERGEVDMALKPWAGIKSGNGDWLRDRKIVLIVQYSGERNPELAEVPTIVELAKTDEQRQVFGLLTRSTDIGRALSMPPGVPADRVAVMRKAFADMIRDPAMLAEAKKLQLDLEPADGARLEKIVASTFDIGEGAVARAKAILAQGKKKKKKQD
ncbi:MAG: hypothetical protein RL477_380 [Pseudomonadota bacterium]